jgi:hypothetical protein
MFGLEDAIKKQMDSIDKKYAALGGMAVTMSYRDFAALETAKSIVSFAGPSIIASGDSIAKDAYRLADALLRAKSDFEKTYKTSAAVGK